MPQPKLPIRSVTEQILYSLCSLVFVAACDQTQTVQTESSSHALTAQASAGPQAAKPPGALSHDERADSPNVAQRPPRNVPRLSDDLPTTREHLAAKGRLAPHEVAGKLPKQQEREPSTARPLPAAAQAPADLADRYRRDRRYEEQWKALEATGNRGLSAEQRKERREALKRSILEGGN
jgi:hypothetical protein